MNITSAMLLFLLSRMSPVTYGENMKSIPVDTVRLYHPSRKILSHVFYLVDSSLTVNLPANAESFFLLYGSRSISMMFQMENRAALPDITDGILILEKLPELFNQPQAWDNHLKTSVIRKYSLEKMLKLGSEILLHPYAVVYKDQSVLHVSPGFWKASNTSPNGNTISVSDMFDTISEDEYHTSSRQTELYTYTIPYQSQSSFLCGNIFLNNEYAGRITVPFSTAFPISPGEKELIAHFLDYIRLAFTQSCREEQFLRSNDNVHRLLIQTLETTVPDRHYPQILGEYGWQEGDSYTLVALNFFDKTKWKDLYPYLCGQLEYTFPYSCAVSSHDSLIWLVNRSKTGQDDDTFHSSLAGLIRDYVCKAGISNTFTDFEHIYSYYQQTGVALRYGNVKAPHSWYYLFHDYVLDYIREKITEDIPLRQLCDDRLFRLMDYDREHSTEYTLTAKLLLEYKGNITHAARQLNIHRTSLIKRIDRISQITGINLSDPGTQFYLSLSFWLLEEKNM